MTLIFINLTSSADFKPRPWHSPRGSRARAGGTPATPSSVGGTSWPTRRTCSSRGLIERGRHPRDARATASCSPAPITWSTSTSTPKRALPDPRTGRRTTQGRRTRADARAPAPSATTAPVGSRRRGARPPWTTTRTRASSSRSSPPWTAARAPRPRRAYARRGGRGASPLPGGVPRAAPRALGPPRVVRQDAPPAVAVDPRHRRATVVGGGRRVRGRGPALLSTA